MPLTYRIQSSEELSIMFLGSKNTAPLCLWISQLALETPFTRSQLAEETGVSYESLNPVIAKLQRVPLIDYAPYVRGQTNKPYVRLESELWAPIAQLAALTVAWQPPQQ